MNKKTVYSAVILLFLCSASSVMAVAIENPINAGSFGALFSSIAIAVGDLIAGLGAVMMIVAGILFVTSAGSAERIGSAKKALIYAIIGIALGIGASSIVGEVTKVMGTK
jgi:hypothetical protein